MIMSDIIVKRSDLIMSSYYENTVESSKMKNNKYYFEPQISKAKNLTITLVILLTSSLSMATFLNSDFIALQSSPEELKIIIDLKSRSFPGGVDEQDLEVQSDLFKPSKSGKIFDAENLDKSEQEEDF